MVTQSDAHVRILNFSRRKIAVLTTEDIKKRDKVTTPNGAIAKVVIKSLLTVQMETVSVFQASVF